MCAAVRVAFFYLENCLTHRVSQLTEEVPPLVPSGLYYTIDITSWHITRGSWEYVLRFIRPTVFLRATLLYEV